ncbi:MAG: [Fe-Fe] hydrogenase large subunit C-terminal domain-containing protein [Desulfococcaceae bacterium]|nr:[Fe-Fe] hydrogenase large subunit C-terminal domain-containing protein [Desulfococcaceae bacterium]
MEKVSPSRYVHFDKDSCTACYDCVRICPTRALRFRDQAPRLRAEQCIGCGECIRVCSAGAVRAATCKPEQLDKNQISVALVSPVLYSQFPGVHPETVLQGLRQMGFRHAVDMSYFLEMFQFATEDYIRRNRKKEESPWPLISPVCPVIVRLIAYKFPNLLANILPVARPLTIMIREVVRRLHEKYDNPEQPFHLYYIVPCPTKMEPGRGPFLKDSSYEVRALGFNDIFGDLRREICKVPWNAPLPDFFDYETTVSSLIWGSSGGETADLKIEDSLAVSGLKECMSYLEKIEMGLFREMEYIEFRTCTEGCVGGILTATDRYLAKRDIQQTILQGGIERRVTRSEFLRFYQEGRFAQKNSLSAMHRIFGVHEKPLSLEKMAEIYRLLNHINGKNCAACGAPDCRTFAEDVVRGEACAEDCLELRARGKKMIY